jgi:YjjG family noncanonical pyrimidine nucleotidase
VNRRQTARRYQWLLFDADGTLFDYDRAERAALAGALQQIGVAFEPEHLTAYRRFNQQVWQAFERGQITPDALKVRRFELLFQSIGVAHSPADFSPRYLAALADCSALLDGALEVVQTLRKNHQIAVVTNGLQAVQRRRLNRSAIRDCVAEVFISEELGVAKPAPEFFDAVFARLGNPTKRDVLMIGDNWSSDIVGGVNYGLDTCWYNPSRQPRPNGLAIIREITSLHELPDWLT